MYPDRGPHPYPVVLVHGTFENRFDNWQAMSPALKAAGYCVYALNYGSYNGSGLLGIYGVGEMERSARELRDFVAGVRASTGAAKVSLVGHSQGGLMPRYFIKYLGGAAIVDDLVGLAPSNHGTTNPLAPSPASPARPAASRSPARRSCATSTRATRRRATSPTRRSSRATTRSSIPYTSGYLAPDANVTNVTLQDLCPNDTSEHLRIPYDPPAIRLTLNALGRPGRPTRASAPPARRSSLTAGCRWLSPNSCQR